MMYAKYCLFAQWGPGNQMIGEEETWQNYMFFKDMAGCEETCSAESVVMGC